MFKPGDQVRFRLGERMPLTMPCCGEVVDQWQILVDLELTHGEFEIGYIAGEHSGWSCDECKAEFPSNPGYASVRLKHKFIHQGASKSGFGAYESELELVD